MAATPSLQVQLAGDYATLVKGDGAIGYWRLGDFEGYAQAVLSDEPTSYWRMDAASGTTETDQGGGGHNATYSGSFTLGQPGALADGDTSADFVSQAGQALIGVVSAFCPTSGPFTVEAWCQPLRSFINSTNYEIFGNETFNASGLIMRLQSNHPTTPTAGLVTVRTSQAGASTVAQTGFLSTINLNLSVHVVWTYDGTNSRIYVNGALAAGPTAMSSPVAATATTGIGAGGVAGQKFNGLIDEVAFYPYALSAPQIANHYALRTSTIATPVAKATIADATGNGHTGTIVGGITLQQAAVQPDANTAGLFDGATGCVFVPDAAPLEIVGALSLEAWVKYTSTVSNGFIISKSAGGVHGYELFRQASSGQLRFSGFGTTLGFDYLTVASYNDGAWHHVVATWDGVNGHIYVDSVAVSITTVTLTGGLVAGTEPLLIGGRGTGGVSTFNGAIDEVAVYPVALTAGQILNHYLAGQWTDITPDLTSAAIALTRGFQSPAPDDLVSAPGTISFGLNNSAHNSGGVQGYYSPDSAALRHGFQTGIRCRYQVTANGTTRTRFYGWLQEVVPKPGLFDEQTVAVTGATWMQMASSTIVAGVVAQINQRGDQLTATLLALGTFPPFATALSAGVDTFPYALDDLDPTRSTIVDGFDSTAKSGLLDRIWEKADGTLVFESRWAREQGVSNAITLTDVAPGGSPGLALIALPAKRSRASLLNRFQVTVHPKRVDAAAVILYAYQTSASDPMIAPMSTVTIQAPYVDPANPANRIGGFNTLIDNGGGGSMIGASGNLPTADWQITSAAAGGGTDISANFTVTVVYSGTQATFTITNLSTVTGFLSRLQCRGQGIYDYQVAVGVAANASSQNAQGQVVTQIDCPYQPDPNFAQLGAQYLALLFGTPQTALDQGVQMFVHGGDEATMDTLLQREISDAIAITETVTGLSSGLFWINAVQESYDERMNLTLTWMLQPRDPNQYWILGVAGRSELGQTTVLGYV